MKKNFRNKKVPFSQKKRIVQLYCRGKGYKEITRLENVSDYIIKVTLNEYMPSKDRNLKLSPKWENLVIKMYLAGYGGSTIAKYFEVKEDVIYRVLKRRKIDMRDFTSYRTYDLNEDFFEVIDTEEKAYWLGFLFADGSNRENRSILLRLSEKDEPHLLKFKKSLSSNAPIYRGDNGIAITKRVTLHSKKLTTDLSKHGVVINKTFKTKFPNFRNSEMKRHFIRGYFDGDGSLSFGRTKDNSFYSSFSLSGVKSFLTEIQMFMIDELDLNKAKLIRDKSIHRLSYGGRLQTVKIMDWIYKDATIYLDRKHATYLELKKYGAELKLRELLENPNE